MVCRNILLLLSIALVANLFSERNAFAQPDDRSQNLCENAFSAIGAPVDVLQLNSRQLELRDTSWDEVVSSIRRLDFFRSKVRILKEDKAHETLVLQFDPSEEAQAVRKEFLDDLKEEGLLLRSEQISREQANLQFGISSAIDEPVAFVAIELDADKFESTEAMAEAFKEIGYQVHNSDAANIAYFDITRNIIVIEIDQTSEEGLDFVDELEASQGASETAQIKILSEVEAKRRWNIISPRETPFPIVEISFRNTDESAADFARAISDAAQMNWSRDGFAVIEIDHESRKAVIRFNLANTAGQNAYNHTLMSRLDPAVDNVRILSSEELREKYGDSFDYSMLAAPYVVLRVTDWSKVPGDALEGGNRDFSSLLTHVSQQTLQEDSSSIVYANASTNTVVVRIDRTAEYAEDALEAFTQAVGVPGFDVFVIDEVEAHKRYQLLTAPSRAAVYISLDIDNPSAYAAISQLSREEIPNWNAFISQIGYMTGGLDAGVKLELVYANGADEELVLKLSSAGRDSDQILESMAALDGYPGIIVRILTPEEAIKSYNLLESPPLAAYGDIKARITNLQSLIDLGLLPEGSSFQSFVDQLNDEFSDRSDEGEVTMLSSNASDFSVTFRLDFTSRRGSELFRHMQTLRGIEGIEISFVGQNEPGEGAKIIHQTDYSLWSYLMRAHSDTVIEFQVDFDVGWTGEDPLFPENPSNPVFPDNPFPRQPGNPPGHDPEDYRARLTSIFERHGLDIRIVDFYTSGYPIRDGQEITFKLVGRVDSIRTLIEQPIEELRLIRF